LAGGVVTKSSLVVRAASFAFRAETLTIDVMKQGLSVSDPLAAKLIDDLVAWGIVVRVGLWQWQVAIPAHHRARALTIISMYQGAPIPSPSPLLGFQRSATGRPCQLSRAEKTVLLLTAEGLSADAAAQRLALSVNTVKTYLGHVYRKLGAADRANAVHQAHLRGIFDDVESDPETAMSIYPART
jgi:DNA-binding CsgD family transcriptional regulator